MIWVISPVEGPSAVPICSEESETELSKVAYIDVGIMG
jgi:hypothetical protein